MVFGVALGAAAAASGAALVVRGDLAVDLGWGRRMRPLGPLFVDIAAPRQAVFEVVSAPYLKRTPRALAPKLRVLERGRDMVLAAHYTPAAAGLVATTVETVRFTPPERVDFRLVRGPVPYVEEAFLLSELESGTRLEYRGELGTDLWAFGRWWGRLVARRWETVVANSLESIRTEAERRGGQVGAHRA